MVSDGARQRATATTSKSSACIASTTSNTNTNSSTVVTQIDQAEAIGVRKAVLSSWHGSSKDRRSIAIKLMVLMVLFSCLQYRLIQRKVQRAWRKRYEYKCASYAYPSPWWCSLVGQSTPRQPKLLDPSNEMHYVSAKFGWPASRFQPQVENIETALMSSGLFWRGNLHLYYDFPQFITSDERWKEHLQFRTIIGNNGNNNNRTATAPSTHQHQQQQKQALVADYPSRGGGYWFWKTPLLLNVLEHHAQHGDVIVYSDVDMVDHLSWLGDFVDFMIENDHNLGLYKLEFMEGDWVKRDVFLAACSDQDAVLQDQVLSSPMYGAPLLIFRSTPSIVTFLKQWKEWASHYHWINDEASAVPNLPTFQEHRHDQALLSLLIKCHYADADKSEFVRASMGSWSMVSMKV